MVISGIFPTALHPVPAETPPPRAIRDHFSYPRCLRCAVQPKVQAHFGQCAARSFTCIDCSRHFDRNTYKARSFYKISTEPIGCHRCQTAHGLASGMLCCLPFPSSAVLI